MAKIMLHFMILFNDAQCHPLPKEQSCSFKRMNAVKYFVQCNIFLNVQDYEDMYRILY